MLDAGDRLTVLAEAIADGETPDWDSASEEAETDEERAAVRQLRAIADACRMNAELAVHASSSVRGLLAHERPGDGTGAVDVPVVWGSLRIHDKIGRGRFGDVYRAWDPSLEREVALKLLRHDHGATDRLVVDEGRLMARVRHPNVATIYGALRINGRTGLWMELIEGQTLEAELAARGPFEAADLARIGTELCRALTAVHRAGLVHRDVKAPNVLHEVGGRIVLGDFGTGTSSTKPRMRRRWQARRPIWRPRSSRTRRRHPSATSTAWGPCYFISPRTAIRSAAARIREIREAHLLGTRVLLRDARPDLPEPLATAVDTALEPDPARRVSRRRVHGGSPRTRPAEGGRAERPAHLLVADGGIRGNSRRNRGRDSVAERPAQRRAAPCEPHFFTCWSYQKNRARSFRQISPDPTLAGPGGPSPDGRLLSYVDQSGDLAIHGIATGKRWALTGNSSSKTPAGYAETSRFTSDGARLLYVWYSAHANGDNRGRAAQRVTEHLGLRRRAERPVERYRQQPVGLEALVGRQWPDSRQRMAGGTALPPRGR